MNKRINNLAKKVDEEVNIIRKLIPISEKKNVPLIEIARTYTKYLEENAVGDIPDVLYFDPIAYKKTKQYYK